jgi:hypothetical protein
MDALGQPEPLGEPPDSIEIRLRWQPTDNHQLGAREERHRLHQ